MCLRIFALDAYVLVQSLHKNFLHILGIADVTRHATPRILLNNNLVGSFGTRYILLNLKFKNVKTASSWYAPPPSFSVTNMKLLYCLDQMIVYC